MVLGRVDHSVGVLVFLVGEGGVAGGGEGACSFQISVLGLGGGWCPVCLECFVVLFLGYALDMCGYVHPFANHRFWLCHESSGWRWFDFQVGVFLLPERSGLQKQLLSSRHGV